MCGKLEDKLFDAASAALSACAKRLDTPEVGRQGNFSFRPELLLPVERLRSSEAPTEPKVLQRLPGLYVLWKPPGWSASVASDEELLPTRGRSQALRDWLREHFGHHPIVQDAGVTHGLVHRLDSQTSGAILWAPSYFGLFAARLQFAARRVCKEYICLCQGHIPVGNLPFRIEAPLLERGGGELGPSRSEVSAMGRQAITEVLDAAHLRCPDGKPLSLAKVRLHTGRTHQIRAHMGYEGYPLVGDPAYGGPSPNWCPRQWLHAWHLRINVPAEGLLDVEVPVPSDLRTVLQKLTAEDATATEKLQEWILSGDASCPSDQGY
ncbi:unnamed protein product [Polarella glacialis]|uniref:Pseudouridine synthase RsuA/RluA-like domain-containing protein n=1 Tax=Polarella glacialis TaxID=89957 RepID=A0A813FWS2_POLGL|nr:unnamed protein product [Polarella glacialis]